MRKKVCISLLVLIGCVASLASAEIVLIAHPEVPDTTLSPKAVQEIFQGKQVQWADNSVIRVVTVKDPAIHAAFLEQYLKKSLSQWNTYWKRMVFTGQGILPEQVETQEELLEYVSTTTGAIGYLDPETVTIENVNMLEVK